MRDASYFTRPVSEWRRRYEALRASFVERLPAKVVAERFGYTPAYVNLLRHLFRSGKIDFDELATQGGNGRRRVTAEVRALIKAYREQRLSGGEIAELLSEQGHEVSVRTVERVLAEEGFPRLPRRTALKAGLTVKGALVPEKAEPLELEALDGKGFESPAAGVFLFAPFIKQLDLESIVKHAGLPGSQQIPATNYLLAFLAVKLLGTERFSHVGDHAFDAGLGLFAGLNCLPKCTALSTYAYGLDDLHISRLQEAFVRRAYRLGLYDGSVVNLDLHAVPHHAGESVLERQWVGARGRRMKAALTLFSQDASSKLLLYTSADIVRQEASEQAIKFLAFWRKIRRKVRPTLVFDSRFSNYQSLSELNSQGVKFITLRRRGERLLEEAEAFTDWRRIHIPHAKRKYPYPEVHESRVRVRNYEGELRQVIVRGHGREKPAFLLSNDFDMPVELLVGHYARRWRVENGIAEAVNFFHLNALSSPILTKVHFDLVLTMMADTLYGMLARQLRGFEECHAPKLYRHFITGGGTVHVKGDEVTVSYPKKAHTPIVRRVNWSRLPQELTLPPKAKLTLRFG